MNAWAPAGEWLPDREGAPVAVLTICPPMPQQQKDTTSAKPRTEQRLLRQFEERLQGSRFRALNEALYTRPGHDAAALLSGEPELFAAYHAGFRAAVARWPVRPVDAAVTWVSRSLPRGAVVADFGCGEAALAAAVTPKRKVVSLDLVAAKPGIIACDMATTPLAAASVDAAVFSLSLMGTDYGAALAEAARATRQRGWLWIAEVRSRFAGDNGRENFKPFLAALQELGYELAQPIDAGVPRCARQLFAVFVLRKVKQVAPQQAAKVAWPILRPCVYRRR